MNIGKLICHWQTINFMLLKLLEIRMNLEHHQHWQNDELWRWIQFISLPPIAWCEKPAYTLVSFGVDMFRCLDISCYEFGFSKWIYQTHLGTANCGLIPSENSPILRGHLHEGSCNAEASWDSRNHYFVVAARNFTCDFCPVMDYCVPSLAMFYLEKDWMFHRFCLLPRSYVNQQLVEQ